MIERYSRPEMVRIFSEEGKYARWLAVELAVLNVMHLATPQSAILSAVIFNALIIIVLIPLALTGVKYRPIGAAAVLRKFMLIYGLGGIVVPFVGIKIIDLLLVGLGAV